MSPHPVPVPAPLRRIVGRMTSDSVPLGPTYERLECGHAGRILGQRQVLALGTRRRCQACVGSERQHHALNPLSPGTRVRVLLAHSAFLHAIGTVVARQTTCPCCEVYGVALPIRDVGYVTIHYARQELLPVEEEPAYVP